MDNLKRYQICHDLITYFATLISPKKKVNWVLFSKDEFMLKIYIIILFGFILNII